MQSDPTVQQFTGVTSILHENFLPSSKDWDIAVIRLRSPLTFNDYVQPICLPSSSIAAGTDCVATGWGHTKSTRNRDFLIIVVVVIHKFIHRVK